MSDFLRREGETDSAFAERTRALMVAQPLTGRAGAADRLLRALDALDAAGASGDHLGALQASHAVHTARGMAQGLGLNVAWSRRFNG